MKYSSFLELPAELRLQVYNCFPTDHRMPSYSGFFLSCLQVYCEAWAEILKNIQKHTKTVTLPLDEKHRLTLGHSLPQRPSQAGTLTISLPEGYYCGWKDHHPSGGQRFRRLIDGGLVPVGTITHTPQSH